MSNIFDAIATKLKGSSFSVWVHTVAWVMLLIGLNHFAEDTYSSFLGIQWLEREFGLNPANWHLTYWSMSLAPQVGQIIFLYIFALNPKKNWWALPIVSTLFAVDFAADVQDRSNGQFLINGGVIWNTSTTVAAGFTLNYFTVGSELFVTAAVGIILATFQDALKQFVSLYIAFRKTILDARKQLLNADKPAQQERQPQERRQPERP